MKDPRYEQLADVLVSHSCKVKPGERVMVEAFDVDRAFVSALIRRIGEAGGLPFVTLRSNAVMRDLMQLGNADLMREIGAIEASRMERMQAYIGIRGNPNVSEWSDISADHMDLYQKHWWVPTHREIRVPKTKWVVLRWPNGAMAQQAGMSTDAFEDFYFRVCTADYQRMASAMQPLIDLMNATDRVRVTAPGTDLSFSIKDIPAVGCAGENNIPDGEVFTAPVRDSANGVVQFNSPTIYRGSSHDAVRLVFENGRITDATSSNTEDLVRILDADEGARYLGEFAIGFHPHIHEPMRDILFDEKIAGSVHITPGSCYEEASNGNKSQIHWDMVLRQAPEVGGGALYFDDRLIRQDGRFVIPELEGLNPERLGA